MYRKIISSQQDLRHAASYLAANALTFTEKTPKELIVVDYKPNRSAAQNRLLWGFYYKNLSDALEEAGYCVTDDNDAEYGYCKDLLHEIFRDMFLVKTEITRKGKTRKLYYSTADLPKSGTGGSKPSFPEYLDKIKNFARDYWQIDLEDPMDGYWRSYFEEALK